MLVFNKCVSRAVKTSTSVKSRSQPYGRIPTVLSGDPRQPAPISDNPFYGSLVSSDLFKEFEFFKLSNSHRMDKELLEIINRIGESTSSEVAIPFECTTDVSKF